MEEEGKFLGSVNLKTNSFVTRKVAFGIGEIQ